MIIFVYTIAAYITWLIGFGIMVNGPATLACTPTLDTTSVYEVTNFPFFNNKKMTDIQQWAI